MGWNDGYNFDGKILFSCFSFVRFNETLSLLCRAGPYVCLHLSSGGICARPDREKFRLESIEGCILVSENEIHLRNSQWLLGGRRILSTVVILF